DRGVRLVAAGRAHALVLVVDACRGAERLLESPRAKQRRRAPELEDVAHLVGDLDPARLADLLLDQLHREERGEILRADRLAGARVQHGRRGRLEVGLDVVPLRRNVLLVEEELGPRLVARLGCHTGLLRGSLRPVTVSQSLRRSCYTVAMPPSLTLPRADGTLTRYSLTGQAPITGAPGPIKRRLGMAAVHAVADPLAA